MRGNIMKKLVIFAALTLGGCATFSNIENGLSSLVGKPVQVAFNSLGYPSGQMKIGDDTVYGWGRNFSVSMPTTATAHTAGYVGSTPYSGNTTATTWTPTQYSCDIKIIAGPDGIIKNWQYDGNVGGCAAYAKPLGRLARP